MRATWVIGLRNRFFVIILASLVVATLGVSFVHIHFFKSQRIRLIDQQIAECADELLRSQDFLSAVKSSAGIEDAISKVLRGRRIGKIFLLRKQSGEIIYQSFNLNTLDVSLPFNPGWVASETREQYLRLENNSIPGDPKLILQVGLVVDKNFLEWKIIDREVVIYVAGIVIVAFMMSVALTLVLLKPIRLLVSHLNMATASLVNLEDVEPLPHSLTSSSQSLWATSDEFSSLMNSIQKLIDRINLNYKLTRSWTFQMVHELKTPLAIVRAETDSKRKAKLIPDNYATDIIKEVENMSNIVSQFLEWAELESTRAKNNLHALRISTVVKAAVERVDKLGPGRIRFAIDDDFTFFANPSHIDQVITNLLSNALKYSDRSLQVDVAATGNSLVIQDYGRGISPEVMERLGTPFNVGKHDQGELVGNGLGLAWVSAVAKLYRWKIAFDTGENGTRVTIQFSADS